MSYRKFFLRNLKVAAIKNKTSCRQHVTCTEQMANPEPSLPHSESSNQQLAAYKTSESLLDHKNLLMADKTGLCSENIPLTSSSDNAESSNPVGHMHNTLQFPLLSPTLQKSSVSESVYDSVNSNQAQRSEYIQRDVLIPAQKTSYSVHNPHNSLLPNSWFSKIDQFADVKEKLKSVAFTSGLMQGENHTSQSFLSIKHILSAASSFVHNRSWLPHSLPAESQLSDAKNHGLSHFSSSKQNFTVTSASVSEQGDEYQNHNITGETFSGDSFSQCSVSSDHCCIDDPFFLDGSTSDLVIQKHSEIKGEVPNSTNVPIESPISITPNNQRRARNRAVCGRSIESRCSTSSSGGISIESRISGMKTRSKSFEESRKLRRLNGRARVWNTTPPDSEDNTFSGKRNDTPRSSGNTLLINQRPASSNKICRELYNEETMANKESVGGNTVQKEENLAIDTKDSYSSNIYETKTPVPTIKPKSSRHRDYDTNTLQCKRKRSRSAEGQRINRCVSPMLTRSSSRHTSRRLRCHKAPRRSVILEEYDVPIHKPKSHGPFLLNLQIDSGRKRVQQANTVAAESASSAGDLGDKSESKVEALSHSSVTSHVTEMRSVENSDVFAEDINEDGMKHLLPVDAEAAGCSTQNMLPNDFNLPYIKDIAAENLAKVNVSACVSTSNLNSVEHPFSIEFIKDNKNYNKIILDGKEVLFPKESYTNGNCDKPQIPNTNCHFVETSVSHSTLTSLTRKRRWQSCSIFSEDSGSLSSLNEFYIPRKLIRCHSNDYLENTSSAFSECGPNVKYTSGDIKVLNNNVLHSDPMSAEAQPRDSNSGENTFQRYVETFDDALKVKAKALAARKFRPPSQTELLQREMLRKLQHQNL